MCVGYIFNTLAGDFQVLVLLAITFNLPGASRSLRDESSGPYWAFSQHVHSSAHTDDVLDPHEYVRPGSSFPSKVFGHPLGSFNCYYHLSNSDINYLHWLFLMNYLRIGMFIQSEL